MRKATREEINTVINEFVDISYDKFKSYGYASGYLSSMLKTAMEGLPAKQQKEMLDRLKSAF